MNGEAPSWASLITTFVLALMASGGFWAWLQSRDKARKATTQLLLGLAHDRIIFLGMKYIERGYITSDEYEDFMKYLWEPYSTFGGNGLAEKVVQEVKNLRIQGSINPIYQHLEEKHVERERSPIHRPHGAE